MAKSSPRAPRWLCLLFHYLSLHFPSFWILTCHLINTAVFPFSFVLSYMRFLDLFHSFLHLFLDFLKMLHWECSIYWYLFSKREVSLLKHCYADFHGRVVVWINFSLLLFKTRSVSKSLLKNWIWYTVYTEVEAVINPTGVGPLVSQKGIQQLLLCQLRLYCCLKPNYWKKLRKTSEHLKLYVRLQHSLCQ